MKRNKLLVSIIVLFLLTAQGCGKVTSETGSKQGKTATPVAVVKGTIDVLTGSAVNSFAVHDNEIYVILTKVKPDGTEEELAWGRGQRVIKAPNVPTKSWQTKKSIIEKAISTAVIPGSIDATINVQPTKNPEDDKKKKDKEEEKENRESKAPTQNVIHSYSYDKKDKEIKGPQGNLIYLNWVPSPNPHWEYTIKDVKKGPAYFVIRAYNKSADKIFAVFFEGSSIATSNATITVQPMDTLTTFRTYVLLCAERNDGRIESGRVSIKNIKKRVTKTLIKKLNYIPPDLKQDNFKNKDPRFKQISEESIENELANAVSKEDSSFDQYKVSVQNISSAFLNDEARKLLLMENPPQDEQPPNIPKKKQKGDKNKVNTEVSEEAATQNTETATENEKNNDL